MVVGGNVSSSASGFAIAPGAIKRAMFIADREVNNVLELWSTPVTGGTPLKLSGTPVSGGSASVSIDLTANGQRVVFLARKDSATLSASFGATATATTYTASNLTITPDSRRALLADARNTAGKTELLSIPINAAAPVAISGEMVTGANALSLRVSADSTVVLFAADKDTGGTVELYAASLDGGAILDIDGDGVVLSTTDLLMLTRWQLGIRGTALFGGITFSGTATRTSVTAIEAHLWQLTDMGLAW